MKNAKPLLSTLVLSLLWFAPLHAATGGDSDHGGHPFRLKLTPLTASQHRQLPPEISTKEVLALSRDCSIVRFQDDDQKPYGVYYLQDTEKRTVVSPRFFVLDAQNTDINTQSYPLKARPLNGDERQRLARVKAFLLDELAHPDYDAWLVEKLRPEISDLEVQILSDACFYLGNNRHAGDYQARATDQVIGVHAFTRNAPAATVYLSEQKLQELSDQDLARTFAAEALHHLPFDFLARDEKFIHSLAEAISFGRDSLNARATWFYLQPQLLLAKALADASIEFKRPSSPPTPSSTTQDTVTENHPSHEDAWTVTGPIPPPISRLRSFLFSTPVQNQAQDILDTFNDLFGRIKLTNMRQCSLSYWLYFGVARDRQLGKFKDKAPNESEATMMVLSNYDRLFCNLWNDLYGSSFIGALGYGTSSLRHVSNSCHWQYENPFSRQKQQTLAALSPAKKQQLKSLYEQILKFRKRLCQGVNALYVHGTPFDGSPEERELLYAVLENDIERARKLLDQKVDPNIGDRRARYTKALPNRQMNTIRYKTYSLDTSLLEIAYAAKNYWMFRALVQNGARPTGPLLQKLFARIRKESAQPDNRANDLGEHLSYLEILSKQNRPFDFDIAKFLAVDDICQKDIMKFVLENPGHSLKHDAKTGSHRYNLMEIAQQNCTPQMRRYLDSQLVDPFELTQGFVRGELILAKVAPQDPRSMQNTVYRVLRPLPGDQLSVARFQKPCGGFRLDAPSYPITVHRSQVFKEVVDGSKCTADGSTCVGQTLPVQRTGSNQKGPAPITPMLVTHVFRDGSFVLHRAEGLGNYSSETCPNGTTDHLVYSESTRFKYGYHVLKTQ